jgi:acid stress chaperone HdeA
MNKQKLSGAIVIGIVVACLGLGATAVAAEKTEKSMKPEAITCEEFLLMGKDVQPLVIYWIDGYENSEQVKAKGVVIHSFERPITMVVNECKKAPKDTLWQKIKQFF